MHKRRQCISEFSAAPLFFAFSSMALATSFATPSLSQAQTGAVVYTDMVIFSVPLIIGAGAMLFAALMVIWLLKLKNISEQSQKTGRNQIAAMRVRLDEYEAAFSCLPEVSILWMQSSKPQMFGKTEFFGQSNMSLKQLLEFERWLEPKDATKINIGIRHLHLSGQGFDISLKTNTGQILHAIGETKGGTAIVQLRAAVAIPSSQPLTSSINSQQISLPADISQPDLYGICHTLDMIEDPAWIRDHKGDLSYANIAYLDLCDEQNILANGQKYPELFSPSQIVQQQDSKNISKQDISKQDLIIADPLPETTGGMELRISKFKNNSVGVLRRKHSSVSYDDTGNEASLSSINDLLNAMTIPMVSFDSHGRLKQFNAAYRELFSFNDKWLVKGMNEREIIDHLRREGQLPTEADYNKWRANHLKSYLLKTSRQDVWHLSSGRTLEVIATPNLENGGVIYVFKDITEHLKLQSANNAILVVQSETLNALNEGVAVFGTDGRLRLHNSRLSSIWKLPTNELGQTPHIDQIALSCGKSIPEDGEEIWQRLKLNVIDLDPKRKDESGRLRLKDGRLVDYAIVRLPDAQTLLTFSDVTKSANYETILKERNEALETADLLKDAFVQNVSHELRGPLTSIIGFADLLASDGFGPLSEQQRKYTDYIRSSSATLGTLIDNILDLTNVDAGIARLDLQELDIASLVEKARTGFSATLIGTDSAHPLNLKVSLPDPSPRFIADGKRIVQILYNLLSNASKFSDPGSQIELIVEENSDWIRFNIIDQGIGIPQELKDALQKTDNGQALKELQRSSGIGLSIVKAFVEMHGGNLSMQNNIPTGNRVIVNMPADASKLIDVQISS